MKSPQKKELDRDRVIELQTQVFPLLSTVFIVAVKWHFRGCNPLLYYLTQKLLLLHTKS